MNILVDADACPVKEIIVSSAKKYNIPVFMFVDTSHRFSDDYSTVITVDKGADSVDFAIVNRITDGDICITQDYGLASMVLAKNAYAVHQNGFMYDSDNIDRMLFERHIGKEMRRAGKRGGKFKPRTKEDNEKFQTFFTALLARLLPQSPHA
jgi:uncharacterized protein YaiI (UPF0178 family)